MSITKTRDLHTDTPLWSATSGISVRSHAKARAAHYDVVVVGSGISGALMADALADGTRSVLVIDRRKPVGGSSLASTAMIQHEIDVPLSELSEKIGAAAAKRAWVRSIDAVEALKRRVVDGNIRCNFQPKQTLLLSGDEMGFRALRDEAELRNHAGFDAEFIAGADLKAGYGLDRTGAIRTNVSASANPARMTAGFLRKAITGGAELVCGPDVADVGSKDGDVTLTLSTGEKIRAGHVIFCTGYEFLKRLANASHSVVSTWALATVPNATRPQWLDEFLVWEASDPYLYLRSTPDGRIVAGGEDEDDPLAHQDKAKLRRKASTIAQKVGDLLGVKMSAIDYCWAGPFGVTPTGLPIIDEVSGLKNVFAVMGYGGNGITFSQIASEMISARIRGQQDRDADLFSAGAVPAPRRAA